MVRDQQGFSLIELLIVIAIILIIAAIAIPNLLRSRIAANQASAIGSCRTINTCEVAYFTNYGVGYSSALLQLGPPSAGSAATANAAGCIDGVLASGVKSGYSFPYAPNKPDPNGRYQGYTVHANPDKPGQSGSAYYYTDETYVIRGNTTGPSATSADSSVAQ